MAISNPPAFTNGVYTPIVTPFTADEQIDFAAFSANVLRLAKVGMGLVVLGTNGEASHCSDRERAALIAAARKTLDDNGFQDRPLLAGTGTGSAHETVRLCEEAKAAGASHAIVIASGYFAFTKPSKQAIHDFFVKVFDASPIPVMVYNFPGAAAGLDLDSDAIIALSNHPNCFGVKLTCGSVAKAYRIALHTSSAAYLSSHGPFQVLLGFADALLPAMVGRATGCITGTGNLLPKTVVKLYEASVRAIESGDTRAWEEARELQDRIAVADYELTKTGIPGTKYALDKWVQKGLGGVCRSPLTKVDEAAIALCEGDVLSKAVEYENSL